MITLEKIRKNGILDVVIFQLLNYINELKKGGSYNCFIDNIQEIFQKDFLNIIFIFTIFYLNLKNEKLQFSFPKKLTTINIIILNINLFLDRSYFQVEVNRMIDFIQMINLFFIFLLNFKK